jgi:hypothetical protein
MAKDAYEKRYGKKKKTYSARMETKKHRKRTAGKPGRGLRQLLRKSLEHSQPGLMLRGARALANLTASRIGEASGKSTGKATAKQEAAKKILKTPIKSTKMPKLSRKKYKPIKDPKRKLKKGEERHAGKSKVDVLRRIQARQQVRRMDPDDYRPVKKEDKLSRRPQRRLRR